MHDTGPQTPDHGETKLDPRDALDELLDLLSSELAGQIHRQAASSHAGASDETVRISMSVTVEESTYS